MSGTEIGKKVWAIAEGYLPSWSNGPKPEMESHETICLLNAGNSEARVEITVFFANQEPVGPYVVRVGARRTNHVRLNALTDPAPIPIATDFATLIRSDKPIVVQHTRLDSREAANALMSTMAFAVE